MTLKRTFYYLRGLATENELTPPIEFQETNILEQLIDQIHPPISRLPGVSGYLVGSKFEKDLETSRKKAYPYVPLCQRIVKNICNEDNYHWCQGAPSQDTVSYRQATAYVSQRRLAYLYKKIRAMTRRTGDAKMPENSQKRAETAYASPLDLSSVPDTTSNHTKRHTA